MIKKILIVTVFVFSTMFAFSQAETVEVTGVGFGSDQKKARQDAIDDALRLAVGKVGGVHLKSMTNVENFVTLKDAISTRSKGYVKTYDIIKETPLDGKYEITINATVSTKAMLEDAKTLAQMIGGVNFIVLYDGRNLADNEKSYYDFAYERINEKLNDKGYSRTEAGLFANAVSLVNDASEIGYMNKIGLYTNSEFIIQIKKIHVKTVEKAGGLVATQVTMDVKAYDNCNWRNLGTVVFKSDWKIHKDKKFSERDAITDAIDLYFDRLMLQFNTDIGSWVENGAPYELRYYSFELDDMDFIDYIDKLIEDPETVGEPGITTVDEYFKLVLRSKKSQFGVYRLILKSASQIENFKTQKPSREILYGRQFSLTPKGVKNTELEAKKEILNKVKSM